MMTNLSIDVTIHTCHLLDSAHCLALTTKHLPSCPCLKTESSKDFKSLLPLKEHAHISDCFIYIPVSGKGKEFFAFATWAPEGR